MERTYVASSNIRSIGYDTENKILEVEFHNGSIYQYYNVPQNRYEGLMKAGSKGIYLDTFIKKHGYTYRRIR
ncbi:KTSC domain-containing protein [bacterium]|nr:KTSC domain-containing protein [bacterium]